jgi:hypothetical protein
MKRPREERAEALYELRLYFDQSLTDLDEAHEAFEAEALRELDEGQAARTAKPEAKPKKAKKAQPKAPRPEWVEEHGHLVAIVGKKKCRIRVDGEHSSPSISSAGTGARSARSRHGARSRPPARRGSGDPAWLSARGEDPRG